MKTINVAVDDDLYRRARKRAAEQATTVPALIERLLRDHTGGEVVVSARAKALRLLYAKVDAELGGEQDSGGLEPGWRNRMYDERFDETILGRSLLNR